jgi:hypothetical protein
MEGQKQVPIKISSENVEKDKKGNNMQRLDSPIIDNESNTILFNYSNVINQKKQEINNKQINKNENKNNSSHDKEIMEDSIIYFTKKLKQNNNDYHIFLYISICLYSLDIIVWYFDKQILHTQLNLYSLIIVLLTSISQVFAFKHNFENISKDIYICTQRIIYIYSIAVILFSLNLLYIIFYEITYNNSGDYDKTYQQRNLSFYGFSIIVFFYVIINFAFPIIVLVKLISIKKNIKKLSAAKGEVYEPARIKDVQIINFIIN